MKKKLIIGVGALIVIAVVAVGLFALQKPKDSAKTDAPQKKRLSEPVNVIPREERPSLYIAPTADGHYITIGLIALNKDASFAEYEVEYQTGSLLQGAQGSLELSLPSTDTLLLGSRSAGGSTTYHENVTGGKLLARFEGTENYAVKTDWKYIENKEKETAHASVDAKFQIDSKGLGSQKLIIIGDASGVPAEYPGTLVSEPYFLQTASPLDPKATANLSIRAEQEGELTIVGWDGSKWIPFETTSDGKLATAEVDLLNLYVVVLE